MIPIRYSYCPKCGGERAIFDWACKQAYIELGNMMTAAAQIGIDSCPIEGFDREKVKKLLQDEGILLEDHFDVACFVALSFVKIYRQQFRYRILTLY